MRRATIGALWMIAVSGCSNEPAGGDAGPLDARADAARDCTHPFSCVPCDDAFDCIMPGCMMGECWDDGFCRFSGACDGGTPSVDAGAAP